MLVVVVVALVAQAPSAHTSQQLGTLPTQAAPCFGAVHRAAPGVIAHAGLPCLVVRQQVTKPGLPQVDLAAHFTTVPLHCFGSVPAFTAAFAWCATHETYSP